MADKLEYTDDISKTLKTMGDSWYKQARDQNTSDKVGWNIIDGIVSFIGRWVPSVEKVYNKYVSGTIQNKDKTYVTKVLKSLINEINKKSPRVAEEIEKLSSNVLAHSGSLAQQQTDLKSSKDAISKARKSQASLNNQNMAANYVADQASQLNSGDINARVAAQRVDNYLNNLGVNLAEKYETRI